MYGSAKQSDQRQHVTTALVNKCRLRDGSSVNFRRRGHLPIIFTTAGTMFKLKSRDAGTGNANIGLYEIARAGRSGERWNKFGITLALVAVYYTTSLRNRISHAVRSLGMLSVRGGVKYARITSTALLIYHIRICRHDEHKLPPAFSTDAPSP